jgi:hypothetical protein
MGDFHDPTRLKGVVSPRRAAERGAVKRTSDFFSLPYSALLPNARGQLRKSWSPRNHPGRRATRKTTRACDSLPLTFQHKD